MLSTNTGASTAGTHLSNLTISGLLPKDLTRTWRIPMAWGYALEGSFKFNLPEQVGACRHHPERAGPL
jgi:hypothetical protein